MLYYQTGGDEEWDARSAAENRTEISRLIECGQVLGYLAHVDGEPAGWVNAAPRALLRGIDADEGAPPEDAERVGSIACFVVALHYRGHGIARRLLDAALEGLRRQGLRYTEGYPARDAESDAAAYHGPYVLYEAAGFHPVRELEQQTVMRKDLAP